MCLKRHNIEAYTQKVKIIAILTIVALFAESFVMRATKAENECLLMKNMKFDSKLDPCLFITKVTMCAMVLKGINIDNISLYC